MTSTRDPKTDARRMTDEMPGRQAQERPVGQLRAITENLTTYAAPVVREVAARAAELAAKAGDAAGPLAHKAAAVTEGIGGRVAEKGREIATDLRRDPPGATATSEAAGHPYVSPDTLPGDAGTEAWAATRAGSIVDPRPSTSPAETLLEQARD